MICQITPLNVFAEVLKAVKSEEFKPAIEVDSVPEKQMTNEEMQSLYEKYKSEIQKDISLQKTKIEEYKDEEEKIKSDVEKSLSKEQKEVLKDLSLSSYAESLNREKLTLNSIAVPEIPQDLDAILSGDKVILTWIPSEGADGYNIYQVYENEINQFKTSHSLYDGDYEVQLPDDKVDYTIYVKAYVLDEDGKEIESTKSNQIIVGRGDREITSSFTLNCDHVYRDVKITGGTLDLNGYKLKVFGELSQIGGELDLNNGKLIAFTSYSIRNSASLRMDDEFDYVYVGGNFFFETSIVHDSSYLSKGILQVEGENFQVKGSNGVFLPDGDHKVYLTSSNVTGTTTVDFDGSDNISQFNILAINKPFSKYRFQPLSPVRTLPWYKKLIYLRDKDKYVGIDGTYSPTGHFGRVYADLIIPTRGLDISIGRSYSSKNTRAGMLGVGWTFSYEGSIEVDNTGNIATFYAPDGSTMNFSIRNSSGGDKTYDGMDSRAELYYYQAADSYILETRDRTRYGFDMISGKYCMSYIEDYSGNRITIEFDTNGNIYKVRDEDGRQVTLDYSSTRIDITDTSYRTITYNLNSDGKLYTVTDANGNILYTYEYDHNGFLNSVKVTEQPGVLKQVDFAVYNDIGRLEKWVDINGKVSDFYYEPRQTTIIYTVDGVKRKTVEKFDECYAINEIILDDGSRNIIEYFTEDIGDVSVNKYNEIKSQKDNNGNVTTYERDERGNTTKVINPDGSFRRYGYYTDEARKDLVQWEQDENNNYTYYEYSNERTLIGKYVYRTPVVTEPYPAFEDLSSANSIITTYTYKADGQIESVLEPNQYGTNNKTIYEYNTNGTLKRITDPEGKSISYTYNSYGLVESEVIALNSYSTYMSTWYEYDKNGRVLRKTLCDSNTIESANNKSVERFVYDNMGRLIQKISPNMYNPSDDTLDASGMVAGAYQITNVGYRYEYKGATENVLKETDPEGNVYLYQYDENGNMISKTLPDSNLIGGTDCTSYKYLYDCRNRLVQVCVIPYGQYEITLEAYKYSQEYISPGHLNTLVICKKILNPYEWSTEIKKYNYAGKILEEVKDSGSNEVKISFEYNLNGTVKSSTDGEGYTTWYYYNTLKKPVHIWTPCEGYNGITTKYTYKRIVYDDSGNVINEAVKIDKVNATVYLGSRESIHSSAITTGFYVSTNTYYKSKRQTYQHMNDTIINKNG